MLKKYRTELLIGLFLVLMFFLLRLVSLTKLPIFVDEAIYLRWAQIAKNDANWRFISLTDGKQPLMVWLVMIMMRFVRDPLTAGRLVSVLIGMGSMTVIWILSLALFKSRRLAFFSAFLYLVSPFALVYDRMVLMDALVGFFSLLSLLLGVWLARAVRLDTALILGGVLGGGVLTKTSGFLNIYFLPLTLLVFDWRKRKGRINLGNVFNLNRTRLLKWAVLALLSTVIAYGFYTVLRLSPFFHIIAEKNNLFVFPFREWLESPFYYLFSNLRGLLDWLIRYLTLPLVFLVILSFASLKEKLGERLLLFLWFLAPFAALAVFGKTLYPRFIFSMSLPLLLLAAWSLEKIYLKLKNKWVFGFVALLFSAWPLYASLMLLTDPAKAPIAQSDQEQYILSWPAGYGVLEIVGYLREQAQKGEIYLATEGTFGLMPASFELYFWDHPNVEIKGFFPVKEIPAEVLLKAGEKPTFFVFNETRFVPGEWPLKLIGEFPRPDTRYSMRLYQVKNGENE